MNRHHPYGGYDDRPAARGRGGGPPPGRARPPPPNAYGQSPPRPPPPPSYDPYSASPSGPSHGQHPYYASDLYAAQDDFFRGADRHYTPGMPLRGGAGGGSGGMRGGGGNRGPASLPPRPPPHQSQPPPMNPSDGYGAYGRHDSSGYGGSGGPFGDGPYDHYDPGSSNSYDPASSSRYPPQLLPPQPRPPMPPPAYGPNSEGYARTRPPPPPMARPPAGGGGGYDDYNRRNSSSPSPLHGREPSYNSSYEDQWQQNDYGAPPPPRPMDGGYRHPPDPYGAPPSGYSGGPPMAPPHEASYPPPPPPGHNGGPPRYTYDKSDDERRQIENRISGEKLCRTLFIRNINFETDSNLVREKFETFGEIKTFFDLIERRGIIFVTYYDLRCASSAREALNGTIFSDRPIDVHFSLPREEDKAQRCDRDKNQGTLFMLLKQTKERINDTIIRDVFGQFGDVKSIRRYKDQMNARFVEFWDSRACLLAHDTLNGTGFMGGSWDLKFAWDLSSIGGKDAQKEPPLRRWGQKQDTDERAPLPTSYPPLESAGSPPPPQPYGGYTHLPPPPPPGSYGRPPPTDTSRLEQAQKVQQLLASLGSGGAPVPTPTPASRDSMQNLLNLLSQNRPK